MVLNMMISKFGRLIKTSGLLVAIMTTFIGFSMPVTASALSGNNVAYFGDTASKTDACNALKQLNSNQDCGSNATSTVHNLVHTILNILSFVVGAIAVVMIVLGGFKFITSGGDSQKVSSAKTSLVYALVGLAVVALTQALVHFVLDQSAYVTPCPTDSSIASSSKKCR